jgi:hypothetical protein
MLRVVGSETFMLPMPCAQDRAALAAAANKPIVLEEYGCCKASDYRGKRSTVFKVHFQ